jgi:hypothetical protein
MVYAQQSSQRFVEDIREAFANGIRAKHIQDLFPAIRSKLCASTKAFHCYPGYGGIV